MPAKQLPLSKVEQMYDAYAVRQTASYVADSCGVSRPAATRYIRDGDPGRGIEAFEVRLARMVRSTVQRKEKRLVYTNAQALLALHDQIHVLDDLIQLAAQNLRKVIGAQTLRLTDVAKAIQIRNQIVLAMKPWGETEEETTTEDDLFAGRSNQEVAYLAQHGHWPHQTVIDTEAVDLPDPSQASQELESLQQQEVRPEVSAQPEEGEEETEGNPREIDQPASEPQRDQQTVKTPMKAPDTPGEQNAQEIGCEGDEEAIRAEIRENDEEDGPEAGDCGEFEERFSEDGKGGGAGDNVGVVSASPAPSPPVSATSLQSSSPSQDDSLIPDSASRAIGSTLDEFRSRRR